MLFSNWEVGVSSKVVMRKGAFSTCKVQEATGSLWQGGPPALLWYEASSLVPVEDSSLWWGKLLLRILCLFYQGLGADVKLGWGNWDSSRVTAGESGHISN